MKSLTVMMIVISTLLTGCIVEPLGRGDHGGDGRGDREGYTNGGDRDRDHDGVPNRQDRRPDNPNRY